MCAVRCSRARDCSARPRAVPLACQMIAFVHPGAASCSQVFRDLGYTVQIRETPFNVTDIQENFLREHIVKSGCCGEKEYLKVSTRLFWTHMF